MSSPPTVKMQRGAVVGASSLGTPRSEFSNLVIQNPNVVVVVVVSGQGL